MTQYAYLDISVISENRTYETIDILKTLLNPNILVEILSESTENEGRGIKFEHYKNIPSFQEYLLVSQDLAQIDQLIRQEDGSWMQKTRIGLKSAVVLESVEGSLPLKRIYAKDSFNQI